MVLTLSILMWKLLLSESTLTTTVLLCILLVKALLPILSIVHCRISDMAQKEDYFTSLSQH